MSTIWKSEESRRAVQTRYREILAHWPVPNEQFHIPTREGETFVIASGPKDGPALLLLHGSASNSFMWMGDVAIWSRHFRVYAIDIIGEPGLSAQSRPSLASGAYASWLNDIADAQSLTRFSLIGLSLGGWLAIDYASRHPKRIDKLVVLCPAGVGRNRNVLLWALPLLLLGKWGRRMLSAIIAGPRQPNSPPANPSIAVFLELIHRGFKVRRERPPIFSDSDIRCLDMPVLAILGGKDAMVDSKGVRDRLCKHVAHIDILWLADAGHYLRGQANQIQNFLLPGTGG